MVVAEIGWGSPMVKVPRWAVWVLSALTLGVAANSLLQARRKPSQHVREEGAVPETDSQADTFVPSWPRRLLVGFARTLMLVAVLFFCLYWVLTRPSYFFEFCSCGLPYMVADIPEWLFFALFHVVLWGGMILSLLWYVLIRVLELGNGARSHPVPRIRAFCWQAVAALVLVLSYSGLPAVATSRSLGEVNSPFPMESGIISPGLGLMLMSWTLYVSASVTLATLATDFKWPMDVLYIYAIIAGGSSILTMARLAAEGDDFLFETIGLTAGSYLLMSVLGIGAFLWVQDSSSKASRSNLGAAIIGGGVIAFVIFSQQDSADQRREDQSILNALRTQSDLTGADLRDRDLEAVSLRGRQLRDADLTAAQLSDADLSRARLTDALLVKSNFAKAKLENADLSHAEITCAGFSGANLRGANLSDVTMDVSVVDGKAALDENIGIPFQGPCSLEDDDIWSTVDFQSADLRDATLKNADLRRASFCDANLRGVDLSQAHLYLLASDATNARFYARFYDVKFDSTTLWPPHFQTQAIPSGDTSSCGMVDGS
ncbi:pentapeptide repeat-containing protein [Acrocarpospora sp. B8E8]|uniref:pentapeptide repeat-containing protein n=1 Tax=Acrocarpospora sp. B8E8 TaxID=3153572 RepID=UPI00325F8E2F